MDLWEEIANYLDFTPVISFDIAKWWKSKKGGGFSEHVLVTAIITGLMSGILATFLYTYLIQPQPNLFVQTVQTGAYSQHYVDLCIKNNGTAVGYIHLFVGTQDSYLINLYNNDIFGSSIRISNGFTSFSSPVPAFNLYATVQPGETDYMRFLISRVVNDSYPPFVYVQKRSTDPFFHPTHIVNINDTSDLGSCIPATG